MGETVRFRTDSDFVVALGKEGKSYTIPRLAFRDAKKVLDTVARATALCDSMAAKIAMAAGIADPEKSDEVNAVVQLMMLTIPVIIKNNGYLILNDLLPMLTCGVVTPEVAEELQYEEVCGLINHLIEGNFGSLKNLFASLQAITTSAKSGTR